MINVIKYYIITSVCFWCLLSVGFVSGDVGNLQILLQITNKALKTDAQIHPKFFKKPSKIDAKFIQNRPKWCPGAFRKRP